LYAEFTPEFQLELATAIGSLLGLMVGSNCQTTVEVSVLEIERLKTLAKQVEVALGAISKALTPYDVRHLASEFKLILHMTTVISDLYCETIMSKQTKGTCSPESSR